MPGSGAAKAGLQVGDAISGVDGQPVKQPTDIAAIVSHKSAGDKVSLTITRGEKQQTVAVILGQPQQQPSLSPQQQAALHAMQISVDLSKAMQGKDFARARELLDELFLLNKEDNDAWYDLACVESLTGHTDKAIDCLKKAFDYGYADFRHLERDTDLDAIRSLPQYKDFLAHKDQSQRARAAKIEEELRKSLGSDYLIETDDENRLVFAANVDRQTLDEVKQKLAAQAKALWNDLFDNHFEQYVTIVVAFGERCGWNDGAEWWRLLAPAIIGWSARQIGYSLVRTSSPTSLHWADQEARGQIHPIWIAEGFATFSRDFQHRERPSRPACPTCGSPDQGRDPTEQDDPATAVRQARPEAIHATVSWLYRGQIPHDVSLQQGPAAKMVRRLRGRLQGRLHRRQGDGSGAGQEPR